VKKTIRLLFFTAAALFLMVWLRAQEPKPEALRCIAPTITDARDTLKSQGVLAPRSSTSVVTTRSAAAERVLVAQGDTVTAGQLLAVLRPMEGREDPAAAIYQLLSGLDFGTLYQNAAGSVSCQGSVEEAPIFLFSPSAGIILESNLTEGSSIAAYGTCFVVADTTEMKITAQVTEETIRYLRTGLSCSISVDALGINGLTGTLSSIAPYASQTVSLLEQAPVIRTDVSVSIDDPTGLMPGYTASAIFTLEQFEDILLVPYSCVGQDSEGEYVMTIRNGILCKCPVTTGREFTQGLQILSGIEKNERILLEADRSVTGKAVSLT